MTENGNGNGRNGGVKLFIGGATLIGLVTSASAYVLSEFKEIRATFAIRNERITVLEYKVTELEKKQAIDDEVRRRALKVER